MSNFAQSESANPSARRHEHGSEATPPISHYCLEMSDTLDALAGLLDTENRLLRSGKLLEAGHLCNEKLKLAGAYIRFAKILRDNVSTAQEQCPELSDRLSQKHGRFQSMLDDNLTLTEAARDASESLIEKLAEDIHSAHRSGVYGSTGQSGSDTKSSPVILSERA